MKIKEFLKEKLPYFMLGFIVAGITGVYAASTILGSTVLYDSSKGYTNEETVTGALDELYVKAMEKGVITIYLTNYLKNTVYGKTDSYLYHHINDANGYSEQGIDGWTAQNANDGGYRYSGPDASVNNYICFGTTDLTTCKTDTSNNGSSKYLYRIIGVFGDNVKIIMANPLYNTKTSVATFKWDEPSTGYTNGHNEWGTSTLYSYLNNVSTTKSMTNYPDTTFMSLYDTSGSTTWSEKVATYNWVVGGNNTNAIKVKASYDYEESGKCYNGSANQTCSTVSGKVGLMRVSDYGYAATPSYWNTTNLNSYNNTISSNWLYRSTNSSFEWTISPRSSNANGVWNLYTNGNVSNYSAYYGYAVRPSMYLNSTIQYISGDGSSDNPYIIG